MSFPTNEAAVEANLAQVNAESLSDNEEVQEVQEEKKEMQENDEEEKNDNDEDVCGLDDDFVDGPVTLVTMKGDTRVEITKKNCMMSKVLATMIENDSEATELLVPEVVSGKFLKLVVQYLNYMGQEDNKFTTVEAPINTNDITKLVSAWEVKFVHGLNTEEKTEETTDNETPFDDSRLEYQDWLCEFLSAVNSLDIKPLFELISCKFATMLQGKNAEQMRTHFSITCDYTKEELAKIKEENKWTAD